MKVEVTLTAEFPPDVSYDTIEKLAEDSWDVATLRGAAVTHIEVTPCGGASPRRIVEWKHDCVDLEDLASDDALPTFLLAATRHGIKLERRIRKLHPEGIPGEELEKTVAWTWCQDIRSD